MIHFCWIVLQFTISARSVTMKYSKDGDQFYDIATHGGVVTIFVKELL